jgi:hypothetical protein
VALSETGSSLCYIAVSLDVWSSGCGWERGVLILG